MSDFTTSSLINRLSEGDASFESQVAAAERLRELSPALANAHLQRQIDDLREELTEGERRIAELERKLSYVTVMRERRVGLDGGDF